MKTKIHLFSTLGLFILAYLIIVFITWDFNLGNLTDEMRAAISAMTIIMSVFLNGILYQEITNKL